MLKKNKIADRETRLILDTDRCVAKALFDPALKPWEAIYSLKRQLCGIGEDLPYEEYDEISEGVFVHVSAYVSPSAKITAPAIICGGAKLCHFSHVECSVIGSFATVGDHSCVSSSILFDKAAVGCLSAVRSSIIGYRAVVGASVIMSDARSDRETVEFSLPEGDFQTQRLHMGSLVCDRAFVGDGSVICPGSIIAEGAAIPPHTCVHGFVR